MRKWKKEAEDIVYDYLLRRDAHGKFFNKFT